MLRGTQHYTTYNIILIMLIIKGFKNFLKQQSRSVRLEVGLCVICSHISFFLSNITP